MHAARKSTALAISPGQELGKIETDIKAWMVEGRRGFVNYLGYRFLIGRALLRAKEIVPSAVRGSNSKRSLAKMADFANLETDSGSDSDEPEGFLAWKRAAFPGIATRTLADHAAFAREVIAFHPELAEVDLDTLPAAQCETVFEKLRDCTSGKRVTLGARADGLIPDATPAGGFRPNTGELGAWLEKNHPGLAGKRWAELPAKIQRAFQEAVAAKGAARYAKKATTPAELLAKRQWEAEQEVSTVLPRLEKWMRERTLLALSAEDHPRGHDRVTLQKLFRTLADQLERADGRRNAKA